MRTASFFRLAAVALSAAIGLSSAHAADAANQSRSRVLITSAIDESNRISLEGNTRPEANTKNDRGIVAEEFPMEHMQLLLRRPAEQEQALRKFIDELHDPNSPNYHQWMTAEQFGEKWGLAQEDIASVTRWLEGYGFKVNVVYTNGVEIDFSGTAGQIRRAFQTEIHRLDVKGKGHIANMSDPKIPSVLAEAVEGIASMHDFKPHTMYKSKAQYTFTNTNGTFQAVVPADLATIYNLNPLFTAGTTGKGQTIVVVEDTNMKAADWTAFRNKFGLQVTKFPGAKLTQVHPPSSGTNNCTNPGTNGDEGEAALDVEWASSSAPAAAIELISCADTTTFGGLIAIQNLLNAKTTPPAIMSMSYGECEAFSGAALNAAFNTAFQQAVTEGVSVFVSSGDQAASTCDRDATAATHGIGITGWGETIYNVAVGGTDYSDTFSGTNSTYWNTTNTSTFGSAKSYIPEMPWNDSCASTVIAQFVTGSKVTYGSTGFCNTSTGEQFLDTVAGGGGPSKCATGKPAVSGVVGGTCKGYAKPSWQTGVVGLQADGVRDIPDVSLFAANGVWGHYYVFCFSDAGEGGTPCTGAPSNWAGAGGTSFSSPILAGIQALVNQTTGAREGNPNPVYYKLAAKEYGTSGKPTCNSSKGNTVASTCIFYDVTLGDIDVNCTGTHNCYRPSGVNGVLSTTNGSYKPAYPTTTGWDFATGLGTLNAANLVSKWTSVSP
jgi:subtilase family serine protease